MQQSDRIPPAGLREGGQRLWTAVCDVYVLAEHERVLLTQACRAVDRLDALARVVEGLPELVDDAGTHPALVESRQQAVVLARLLAALRLPDESGQQPQRRGVRGVYRLRALP